MSVFDHKRSPRSRSSERSETSLRNHMMLPETSLRNHMMLLETFPRSHMMLPETSLRSHMMLPETSLRSHMMLHCFLKSRSNSSSMSPVSFLRPEVSGMY